MRRILSLFALSAMLFAQLVCAQTLVASQDTFIDSLAPTANFGSHKQIRLKASQSEPDQVGLIAFDLGPVVGVPVGRATLRLYVDKVSQAGDFSVRAVESAWAESTVTFDTGPSLGTVIASHSVVSADIGTYLEIDITHLVRDWVSGVRSNYGIALVPQNSGMKVWFSSRETSFEPELVVSGKTNIATVEKFGGDYNDPIVAMNDRDSWCDRLSLTADESCRLLIGPGIFTLSQTLSIPVDFSVIGAGKSGSKRTELTTMSGVESAILFAEDASYQVTRTLSDVSIRNISGTTGNAYGIRVSDSTSPDLGGLIIRDVSVEVAGGAMHNKGIVAGGSFLTLANIDVTVVAGTSATGLDTSCALATDVDVVVVAKAAVQTLEGWVDVAEACGAGPTIRRFGVRILGSSHATESRGLRVGGDSGVELATEGTITGADIGVDHLQDGTLSNLTIESNVIGIRAADAGLIVDNVHVRSDTALKLGRGGEGYSAKVTDSTLAGHTYGVWLDAAGFRDALYVDGSVIQGATNSLFGNSGDTTQIGSSKIVGPIDPSVTLSACAFVYDENYQPLVCP